MISNTDDNDTLKIQNMREFPMYIQCFVCHAQENLHNFPVCATRMLLLCNNFSFSILLKSLALALNLRLTLFHCLFLLFPPWVQMFTRGSGSSQYIGKAGSEDAPRNQEVVMEVLGATVTRKPEGKRSSVNGKNCNVAMCHLVWEGVEEYANL